VLLLINHPKLNGITIAGGDGQGSQLNEFHWPKNILVDDDNQCFYVVDWGNDKILEWKFDAKNGKVVAGGNLLNQPIDVILDQDNNSLLSFPIREIDESYDGLVEMEKMDKLYFLILTVLV
jgi:hypothetical protein